MQIDIHTDLIAKAIDGHSGAQKKLFDLYSKAMLNICYRMMNNSHDAEDMMQESFIEAFRKLDTFRNESTFGAWIKRICIHRCINELKRRKVNLILTDQMIHFDRYDHSMGMEEEQVQLTVEKIKHAMALLPHGYRVVFSLYMMEGYDHEEIAEILEISESTSKTQLMRAKKKIMDILGTVQTIQSN